MRKEFRIGKTWRRIFAMMLAMAIISTAVPVDVRGDQIEVLGNAVVSQNEIQAESGASAEGQDINMALPEGEASTGALPDGTAADGVLSDVPETEEPFYDASLTANGNDITAFAADDGIMAVAEVENLFDIPSLETIDIIFSASWYDENGTYHEQEVYVKWTDLVNNPDALKDVKFPTNAEIHMEFQFVLHDANDVADKTETRFRYEIPDGINVNLSERDRTVELKTSKGQVVGHAVIGDGYIDFVFDGDVNLSEVVGDINFSAWFEGSVNEDKIKNGEDLDLQFPTSSGDWNFHATVTEPSGPADTVDVGKAGNIVEKNGKQYIEWTVKLDPSDADGYLEGTIYDKLPSGLVYAEDLGVTVKNSGGYNGKFQGDISYDSGSGELTIEITESDRIKKNPNAGGSIEFTFYTEIDENLLNGKITNNGFLFHNTASYEPDDKEIKTKGWPQADVRITYDVLDKQGGEIDGDTITWTIVINRDHLDISGTTFTDIHPAWAENFSTGDVKLVSPADIPGIDIKVVDGNLTVKFPEGKEYTEEVVLTITTKIKSDYTDKTFKNDSTLTGDHFDVSDSATITDKDLIHKSYSSYDEFSRIMRWTIEVNPEKEDLSNVTVTDDLSRKWATWLGDDQPQVFKFLAAYMDGQKMEQGKTPGYIDNGSSVTFNLGNIGKETKYITVEVEINEDLIAWLKNHGQNYYEFINWAEITAERNGKTVKDNSTAQVGKEVKDAKFIEKDGKALEDGTYEWRVRVYTQSGLDDLKDITITDTLPEGHELVAGSFSATNAWGSTCSISDDHIIKGTSGNNATFTYDIYQYRDTDCKMGWEEKNWFENSTFEWVEVIYKTKASSIDKNNNGIDDRLEDDYQGIDYINVADVTITYGDTKIERSDDAKVSDPGRGVVKKEGVGEGDRITWTVTINEGHYDMGSTLPIITDTLEACYQYETGTLYRVVDGVEIPVPTGDPKNDGCYISVVNNVITVQMPAIHNDMFVFRFETSFTVSGAELKKEWTPLTNTVEFTGVGKDRKASSGEVTNVDFAKAGGSGSVDEGIRILKIDADDESKVLAGAAFDLYQGSVRIGQVITNANGYALFDMNISRYIGRELTLVERTAPSGYDTADAEYFIGGEPYTDKNGDIVGNGITFILTAEMIQNGILDIRVTNGSVSEKPKTGSIRLQKVDADKNSEMLSGARFGLYSNVRCSADDLVREIATTDSLGEIVFNDLAVGTYFLKEVQSPDGYVLSSRIIKVEIKEAVSGEITVTYTDNSSGDAIDPQGGVLVLENKKARGKLTIIKYDDESNLLDGAKFGLYEDPDCLLSPIATGTVGDPVRGKLTFEGLLYNEDYYCKEIEAPAGYALDETIHHIVIIPTSTREDGFEYILEVTNKKELGNLTIYKYDDKNNYLADVTFELWMKAGDTYVPYPNGAGTPAARATTNSSGRVNFTKLPFGDYQIREVGAPDGYEFTVDGDNRSVNVTINKMDTDEVVRIHNDLVTTNIKLTKYGNTKAEIEAETKSPLEGISFVLIDADSRQQAAEGITGADGVITFEDIPYGNYHVVEVGIKEGYQRPENRYCTYPYCVHDIKKDDFYTTTGETKVLQTEIGIEVTNLKPDGSILLMKTGSVNRDGSNPTSLSEAQFVLEDANRNVVARGTSGELDEAIKAKLGELLENSIYKDGITNNNDGWVFFGGLPYGIYYLREEEPPVGYVGDLYEYVIEVKDDTTVVVYKSRVDIETNEEDGNAGSLIINNIYQQAPYISVKLNKQYVTKGEAQGDLRGAWFALYKKGINPGDDWELYASVASDEKGMVYFQRIQIDGDDIGTEYGIRETQAPGGYAIPEDSDYKKIISLGKRLAPDDPDIGVLGKDINVYADGKEDGSEPLTEEQIKWAWNGYGGTDAPDESIVLNDVLYGQVTVRKTGVNAALLTGAIFGIYYDDACQYLVGSFSTEDMEDSNIPQAYRNKEALLVKPFRNTLETLNGTTTFAGLPQGTYYIKEIEPPAGYLPTSVVQPAVVTVGENPSYPTVTFRDEQISVRISKRDTSNRELSGAVFTLYHFGDGATRGNKICDLKGSTTVTIPANELKVSSEADGTAGDYDYWYRLEETTAPKGYTSLINPIIFRIDENGHIKLIEYGQSSSYTGIADLEDGDRNLVVIDKPVTLSIRKTDQTGNTILPGARLALYKENVATPIWTGTTVAGREITIPVGTLDIPGTFGQPIRYTLRELSAPAGFDLANDIEFTINNQGIITVTSPANDTILSGGTNLDWTITMRDMPLESFYFLKLDSQTRRAVAGAKFKLYPSDAAGNEVKRDEDPWAAKGPALLDSKTTPDKIKGARTRVSEDDNEIILLEDHIYTLEEYEAPGGYILPITYKVTFEVYEDTATGELKLRLHSGNNSENLSTDGHTIYMRDPLLELWVEKQTISGQPLGGATLVLWESNNDKELIREIYTFTSSDTGAVDLSGQINALHVGPQYVYALVEKTPPENYKKADPIFFYFEESGVVFRKDEEKVYDNTLIMVDVPVGIEIAKVDVADRTTMLDNCTLMVSAKDPKDMFEPQYWTSGNDERWQWEMEDFKVDHHYMLSEVEAPKGYAYTEPLEFWITPNKDQVYELYVDGVLQPDNVVRIADGRLELDVSKKNFYTGEEVPGATLQIWKLEETLEGGTNEVLVTEWTTQTAAVSVDTSDLEAGTGIDDLSQMKKYVLREAKAPDGYYEADPIYFAIDFDGTIWLYDHVYDPETGMYTDTLGKKVDDNLLIMYEMPHFSIKKLDTQGNYVPGAELRITAKDDPDFEPIKWTTTNTAKFFDLKTENPFTAGVTYVLEEVKAPEGYTVADNIEFKFDETGQLFLNGERVNSMQIVMLDRAIQISVNKVDAGNNYGLAGAKLAIKDDKGEIIHRFISKGEPIALDFEKLLTPPEGYIYVYTLTELEAPTGYALAADIAFGVDSEGNVYLKEGEDKFTRITDNIIVMKDAETAAGSGSQAHTNSKTPKTGDDTPLAMLILLCITGLLGAASSFIKYIIWRRKHRVYD